MVLLLLIVEILGLKINYPSRSDLLKKNRSNLTESEKEENRQDKESTKENVSTKEDTKENNSKNSNQSVKIDVFIPVVSGGNKKQTEAENTTQKEEEKKPTTSTTLILDADDLYDQIEKDVHASSNLVSKPNRSLLTSSSKAHSNKVSLFVENDDTESAEVIEEISPHAMQGYPNVLQEGEELPQKRKRRVKKQTIKGGYPPVIMLPNEPKVEAEAEEANDPPVKPKEKDVKSSETEENTVEKIKETDKPKKAKDSKKQNETQEKSEQGSRLHKKTASAVSTANLASKKDAYGESSHADPRDDMTDRSITSKAANAKMSLSEEKIQGNKADKHKGSTKNEEPTADKHKSKSSSLAMNPKHKSSSLRVRNLFSFVSDQTRNNRSFLNKSDKKALLLKNRLSKKVNFQ